jgi:hypothetical protein
MPTVLMRRRRQPDLPSRKVRIRTSLKPEAARDNPIAITRGIFEQIHADLIAPEPDEPVSALTWEDREAAGVSELLGIHQDALRRPLTPAEFARSEQIVDTLNANNPAPGP